MKTPLARDAACLLSIRFLDCGVARHTKIGEWVIEFEVNEELIVVCSISLYNPSVIISSQSSIL
jgi:hypothetical protein